MKKVWASLLILLFISNLNVHALEWAYWFVVHEGKVYEVKEEESVATNLVGKKIGKVSAQADDYTGDYSGNASNYYKNGTRYFEITGVPIKEAIAVETSPNEYVKAIFKHDIPLEKKIFSVNLWMILGLVLFILLFIVVLISKQR